MNGLWPGRSSRFSEISGEIWTFRRALAPQNFVNEQRPRPMPAMAWIDNFTFLVRASFTRRLVRGQAGAGRHHLGPLRRSATGHEGRPARSRRSGWNGHVAAVIVFDQFSRNMFRRSPERLPPTPLRWRCRRMRWSAISIWRCIRASSTFLYMPFMHAEDRAVQAQSVALFAKIGIPGVEAFAQQHKA